MARERDGLIWDFYNRLVRAVDDLELKPVDAGRVLARIFDLRTDGWRVIGITERALRGFKELDFKEKPSGKPRLERGHVYHRNDTLKVLFEPTKDRIAFPDLDSLKAFWLQRDVTILCLSDENSGVGNALSKRKNGLTTRYYPIQNDDSEVFANRPVGCAFSFGVEGNYLMRLCDQIERGEVTSVDVAAYHQRG